MKQVIGLLVLFSSAAFAQFDEESFDADMKATDSHIIRGSLADHSFIKGNAVKAKYITQTSIIPVPNSNKQHRQVAPAVENLVKSVKLHASKYCEGADNFVLEYADTSVRTVSFTNALNISFQANIVCLNF
ncbi:hypothetical protein [Vibrio sp. OPT46]|uniref:hypothetical protein n=1 Tax=Vibrio sp. OPT46 TaxID=2778645 RepID=UPI00187F4BD5|nr:hypothetical protein [Vibrio sp. OPT46]ELA9085514.1 hypothetical protein [Vibrio alginolyticus]MBE8572080.1 hypothetical protein [Vibrio sp. OPT46]